MSQTGEVSVQVVRLPLLAQGHPQGPHPREAQPEVLDLRPQLAGRGRATGADVAQPRRSVGTQLAGPRDDADANVDTDADAGAVSPVDHRRSAHEEQSRVEASRREGRQLT